MSEPTYPATIDTLGDLTDHGMGAFLLCPTCAKAGRPDVRNINLEWLADHLGRGWRFVGARWPVKCAECGERNVTVRITPPAPPHPGMG